MNKQAFTINKKMMIGAAALAPVTGYVVYHKDKFFPKGTFKGEFARNVAVDTMADLAFAGTGAAIGKKFGHPEIGAMAGFGLSYILPTAYNTKRMLDMHKTSALKDLLGRHVKNLSGARVKELEELHKKHPDLTNLSFMGKRYDRTNQGFAKQILEAKRSRNIARVGTGAAGVAAIGIPIAASPIEKQANTNDIGHYSSKTTPYNIGMYSKKHNLSRAHEAVPQGVESSALHGAVAGAVGGAVLGGPISTRIFTPKGRESAVDEAIKDYSKLKSGVERTGVGHGFRAGLRETLQSENVRKLNRQEIQEIIVRRTKAGAKGALTVGLGMGALRAITNAAQYGAGHAMAKEANLDRPPKVLAKIESILRKAMNKPPKQMTGIKKTGPNDYKIQWSK